MFFVSASYKSQLQQSNAQILEAQTKHEELYKKLQSTEVIQLVHVDDDKTLDNTFVCWSIRTYTL